MPKDVPRIADAILRDMTEFRIATMQTMVEVVVGPSVARRLTEELHAEWDGRSLWGVPLLVNDDVTTWELRRP